MKNEAKQNIIGKIQVALSASDIDSIQNMVIRYDKLFPPLGEEKAIKFAEEFKALGGKFVYCEKQQEAIANLKSLADYFQWKNIYCHPSALQISLNMNTERFHLTDILENAEVIITACDYLVARTGSIVVSAHHQSRKTTIFAPIHIVIAYAHQLKNSLDEIMNLQTIQQSQSSMISVITGPSKTADIEKTLVVGVHGPKELYVIYIDEQP